MSQKRDNSSSTGTPGKPTYTKTLKKNPSSSPFRSHCIRATKINCLLWVISYLLGGWGCNFCLNFSDFSLHLLTFNGLLNLLKAYTYNADIGLNMYIGNKLHTKNCTGIEETTDRLPKLQLCYYFSWRAHNLKRNHTSCFIRALLSSPHNFKILVNVRKTKN